MRFVFFFVLLILFSCQDSQNENVDEATSNSFVEVVTKEDVQSLNYIDFVLDAKVERAISSWEKYSELQKIVLDIKDANLSFFRDNNEIIIALIEDLKTTLPEQVHSPHVEARILALETKLLKLESHANLSNAKKETVLMAIEEVLIAFSNLNLQMNKKIEKESQRVQRPT